MRQSVRQSTEAAAGPLAIIGTMSTFFIIVLTVLVTVIVERAYGVPRDIRRSNERIRNRDEDLRIWLEASRKQVLREFLRIWAAEAKRTDGPDCSVSQCQKVKDEVLGRYGSELRDAERLIRDIELSEQFMHRLARRLTSQPIPSLTAPSEKAQTIANWKTSAEEDLKAAEELRAMAERRRAEAGEPPLRPLRLAELA